MGKMRNLIIFVFLLITAQAGLAAEPTYLPTTSQNITCASCVKNYNMTGEKLFYLTMASIGASKFRTDEIQSKNGYILFTATGKQYLASVVKIDKTSSMLKITPADNVYYFAPVVVTNLFKYIEANASEEIKPIARL